MTSRRRPSARSSVSRTSPKSLTIPVNTALPSFENLATILADGLAADARKVRRSAQRRERHPFERIDAVGSDDFVRAEKRDFVNEIGGKQGRRQDRPGLDHQPADAPLGKKAEHGRQIEPSIGARNE